ncbi:MAG TPA: hypothetical protein VLE53_18755 [Gemmatimonadaceae bacterium]|nr:hypothetical protein [Gemmatimonadaceae bacterium]
MHVLRLCALASALGLSVSVPARAQSTLSPSQLSGLRLRTIGPANMSGRIVDLDVNERNPYVIYAASATGGVWKSTTNGVTWEPIFEKEGTHSVGDIAVHPVDTNLVWVGTGERASRQSSSWGDGVYKSTDGGRTWRHMGLRDSHHIGRIALHPTDASIVFVAAMGHLWGPNEERGLYKSTDGGTTWRRVLQIDSITGVVDVAIDPRNPRTMFAASYQRMRRAFGFHGGGPGSALWKSIDGGETWRKIAPLAAGRVPDATARAGGASAADTLGAAGPNGLPRGEYGRIGISIHRADPRIVYVSIEQGWRYNASTAYLERRAGLYRSQDGGETWEWRSTWNPRPMYASQPLVDPSDPERVYMMNAYSFSDDGGRTFTAPDQSLHGDDRIVWVNPRDSRHVIKGDDGGVGISWDRGLTWLYVTNLPLSQWYRVRVDNAVPFNVYGGLQDNGSWVGPSATYRGEGVLNQDWRRLGGGDGFLSIPDTVDGRTIYAESQFLGLTVRDNRTWETRSIRPGDAQGAISPRRSFDAWFGGRPDPELLNAMAPGNWDGPYLLSPHDHRTIYAGTDRLWKSPDQGETWQELGDMTTGADRRALPIMGQRPTDFIASLDDGVPYWPTITAIAESPRQRGVLYVGTDDGRLRVSRNDGRTWSNAHERLNGFPRNGWISGIEPSRHADGRVYVVANNYRNNDFGNHLWRSDDYGETWTMITGDLPPNRVLRTVREDPRASNLLWLGAELGMYVSIDGGTHWVELKSNMPTMAFNDLVIHPRDNDLVLGTHSRGIWILDNVNAIQELTPQVMASPGHLFTLEPAQQIRYTNEIAHTGDMFFRGENPPDGAIIDYWLGSARDPGAVTLAVHDASGREVATVDPSRHAGINRVIWNLRHADLAARPGSRGSGPAGPYVVPGRYVVRLTVDGQRHERSLEVREDPRMTVAADVRAQWTATLLQIAAVHRQATELLARLQQRRAGASAAQRQDSAPLNAQLEELWSRLGRLYGDVERWTGPMTTDQRSQLDFLTRKLAELTPAVDRVR